MKIAVIGATGMVGSRVVAEALIQGHEVDAYSRHPQPSATTGLTTFALDFANTAEVVDVINKHDVTLLTVAGRDNYEGVLPAHQAIINAAPTGRFIVVGGAGALQLPDGTRLYDSPAFPAEYHTEATTFGAVYDAYMAAPASLNWTMIAPAPAIAPGKRTGELVEAADAPAGNFVSAEDFAVAILAEMTNPRHAHARFTVASKDESAAGA